VLTGRGIGRGRDVAAPATRSRGGARRGLVTRSIQRSERRAAGSGKFLALRRCRCTAWTGLRCGGATWPQWRGALLRSELRGRWLGFGAALRDEMVGAGGARGF
jgi:hypothetical protein